MSNSRLEIDLGAVERNVGVIRRVLAHGKHDPADLANPAPPLTPARPAQRDPKRHAIAIGAVIKQDAYGMGAVRVARRLSACGVEMLAVYSPDEARALAEAPIDTPILVLMPMHEVPRADALYRLAVRGRLHVVAHDLEQAKGLIAMAGWLGIRLPIHVQVDSGMSRGGCSADEAARIVQAIAEFPGRVRLAGVMTHFASAPSDHQATLEQARVFRAWIDRVRPLIPPGCLVHASNTTAMLRSHRLHGTMVRVGLSLFGLGADGVADPENFEFRDASSLLQPAVRWVSRVVHVTEVPAGWGVGYGCEWRAPHPSRIALVPTGYADGYPLGLGAPGRGMVGLTGRPFDRTKTTESPAGRIGALYAPVVGRVSMDQITLDVTDLPEWAWRLGHEVELIGADPHAPNHLAALAQAAGTIKHEFLCRIHPHVERLYLSSNLADESPLSPAATSTPVLRSVAKSPAAPAARIVEAG
ncbi:MAG: alanine racemase [Phycisphaerae bacterium]|nr:alanine racemase [Phycisphaerae bacterium]